jgi:hypothetical protein
MDSTKTALERAFELARSGRYTLVTEIRDEIRAEGYDDSQIENRALVRQLRSLMDEAQRK